VLKCSILLFLLMLIGVLLWQPWQISLNDPGVSRRFQPPVPEVPPMGMARTPEDRAAMRQLYLDALANDGRVLEPGVAVRATGLVSYSHLQLALDEVFTLGRAGQPAMAGRIRPRADRKELENFVLDRVASGAPSTYPVLYVKDAQRVPGNLRVATGEIIAALQPGVTAEEIGKEYGMRAKPEGSSKVGLTRFIAQNAFRALELVPKLAADPRIALVDHDLIKPVQPKALRPRDPMFADQWAVYPVLEDGPQRDYFNIGLFPTVGAAASLLPNAAPVWGDFDDPNGGIRGRGIRVGIVDDGLEVNHPDLVGGMAPFGEHRSYDLEEQEPQFPGDVPPPRVRGGSGLGVEPLTLTGANKAHGVQVAGIIGARANNDIGMAGVAPLSTLVGIRTFSYSFINGFLEAPDPTFYRPLLGDLLSPSQDVMVAAAFEYSANEFYAASIPGKRIYVDTFYETNLPTFSDSGGGPVIHVKNVGFGASDAGVIDGPGPEVGGYYNNTIYIPGARERAIRNGRLGLGTVFVQPAGNGRFNAFENSNNDGYANGLGAITVGGMARFGREGIASNEDGVSIFSEWGANLTVVAPGGGPYWRKTGRANDGRPPTGAIITLAAPAIVPIPATDWSVNLAARPATSTRPYTPALYGLNPGGEITNEYREGAYTKRFLSTSAAAAHVSGVVALMLEANPRLSWMDVQRMLMLTARKHIDPDAYAFNPANPNPPSRIPDGVDIFDPQDNVALDRDWEKNGGNMWFNHKYGAGLVDAGRAVAEAQQGILLPRQSDMQRLEFINATRTEVNDMPNATTPAQPASMTFNVNVAPNFVITHVQLFIDYILATEIGQLGITMNSPSGMRSVLLEPRIDFTDDLIEWAFSSLRYWGENGTGTWTVNFQDYQYDGNANKNDDIKVNVFPPGQNGTPVSKLVLHGYLNPDVPLITKPESNTPATPTVVPVQRGRNFNYSMAASGRPTTWFLLEPLATPNTPGLPPGLRLGTVNPSADTTYLDSRLITGRTDAPLGSLFDVEVIAANVRGLSEVHYLRFEVVPPDTNDAFTQWGNFHFPPGAVGNPLAGGSADPDGDGLINALEFGLGTSPMVGDGSGATGLSQDASSQWNFTFRRYPTRGVQYEVQVSDTLEATSWRTVVTSNPGLEAPDPGAGGVPVSVDPSFVVTDGALVPEGPDGTEPEASHRVVTVVNTPGTPPPLYYRLKVIPPRDPLNPR
jgi:hypothetical protein